MRHRLVQSSIATLAAVLALAGPADAQAPEPYVDPPWADACEIHEFGEGEAPAVGSLEDDPRCVRYAKEDITLDDGGALAFLAAEPERVLAAGSACRYWQQDRWSVQVSDGAQSLVRWAGSYWWDRTTGQAAAVLRDFEIGGQPAGADQVAALIEPLSTEWAEALRAYGGPDGGTGGLMSFGHGDPSCAADDGGEEPTDDPERGERRRDGEHRQDAGRADEADPKGSGQVTGASAAEPAMLDASLPRTGGSTLAGVALLAVAAAMLLRAVRNDRSGRKDP